MIRALAVAAALVGSVAQAGAGDLICAGGGSSSPADITAATGWDTDGGNAHTTRRVEMGPGEGSTDAGLTFTDPTGATPCRVASLSAGVLTIACSLSALGDAGFNSIRATAGDFGPGQLRLDGGACVHQASGAAGTCITSSSSQLLLDQGLNLAAAKLLTLENGSIDWDLKSSAASNGNIGVYQGGTVLLSINYSTGNTVAHYGVTLGASYGLSTSAGSPLLSTIAPTITSACTSPTVTNGVANGFVVDVGSSCTGVTSIVLGLPTATNGWRCDGYSKTTDTATLDQIAPDTTTAVTMQKTSKTTGLAVDFAAGEDLRIRCTPG